MPQEQLRPLTMALVLFLCTAASLLTRVEVVATIFGVAALTAWQQEDIRVTRIGERFQVGDWGIQLDDVQRLQGPNYITTQGTMSVWRDDTKLYELTPEKRVYPVAGMPTTEAAIHNGILRDIYLVIGDPQNDGGWAVRDLGPRSTTC